MIWFDVTKASAQKHRSGLTRVSGCLRAELAARLGAGFAAAVWHARRAAWVSAATREPIVLGEGDWLVTPELFCEEERPGLGAWLAAHGDRAAALFHDAIPLRFPEITWPQSVARHPDYMRLLAGFGRVFAVSEASARELRDYWAWTGRLAVPDVRPITLGADGHGRPRVSGPPDRAAARDAVMIGIVEPRKDQEAVLDAVETLATQGIDLAVAFVGRVNPHFGRATVRRIRAMARSGRRVVLHEAIDDRGVADLLAAARFSLLPSRAEGCGLPVLESLWAGLPVLATALPAIVESAAGGGCLLVPPGDAAALVEAMRQIATDDALVRRLAQEAVTRPLPSWRDTARQLVRWLDLSVD
ncbi:MAG: glycosyltransferase [Opitutaceae bacterium]|nr:glycosyltransferase [Opitutaceae bacterium]